jgi:hypothetical protein
MELLSRRTLLRAAAASGAAGALIPGLARAAVSGTEMFTSDEAGLLVGSVTRSSPLATPVSWPT